MKAKGEWRDGDESSRHTSVIKIIIYNWRNISMADLMLRIEAHMQREKKSKIHLLLSFRANWNSENLPQQTPQWLSLGRQADHTSLCVGMSGGKDRQELLNAVQFGIQLSRAVTSPDLMVPLCSHHAAFTCKSVYKWEPESFFKASWSPECISDKILLWSSFKQIQLTCLLKLQLTHVS